jgi:hypothetical protein
MKAKFNNPGTKQIFFLLMLFFLITTSANAQEYFYYKSYGEYSYDFAVYNPFLYKKMPRPNNVVKELQFKEQKMYCQNFKKDTNTYLQEEKFFDNNGYETLIKRFSSKGKLEYHTEKKYSENGRILMNKGYNRKGKLNYSWEYVLDEKGNTKETKSYNKNGILVYHTVYSNNEQGKISESKSYYDKAQILLTRMVYTYYTNGDKETTIRFDRDGRIEKVWSYACSAEGTEIRKMKDTVQVCKISDYNKDGSFSFTNRTINEEGKLEKTVSKFAKDSIQIEASKYDDKDRLVYISNTKKTENGWMTEFTDFYVKKAKPHTIVVNLYNNERELITMERTSYKRNGKISGRSKSEYRGINQCLKIVFYNKGGTKIKKSTISTYTIRGLLQEVNALDEKGIVQTKTLYQYQ